MADTRYQVPRRPGALIYLQVAEIVDVVTQPQMIDAMSDAEVGRVKSAFEMELNKRSEQK